MHGVYGETKTLGNSIQWENERAQEELIDDSFAITQKDMRKLWKVIPNMYHHSNVLRVN